MALYRGGSSVNYRLATIAGRGEWADWIEKSGAAPLVSNILKRGFVRFGALVKFIKAVREFKPDILYVVGIRAATLVGLIVPFLGSVKLVHGIRTTFKQHTALTRIFHCAQLLFGRLTDAYVANSQAGAEALRTIFRIASDKIYVIQNGITIPPAVLEHRSSKSKTIVVIANMHPLKGHREFIDVIELVLHRHPDAEFQLVGRDDMDGEINRMAQDRGLQSAVKFAGFQSDVWPWLLAAQIFVLPSREIEGSPTAILEALGAGLPVVAFSVGGIPQLVRDGIDGYVVKDLDSKVMARAIITLLDNPSLASRMGTEGRNRVVSEFSLQASASKHAQLWQHLLRGH